MEHIGFEELCRRQRVALDVRLARPSGCRAELSIASTDAAPPASSAAVKPPRVAEAVERLAALRERARERTVVALIQIEPGLVPVLRDRR